MRVHWWKWRTRNSGIQGPLTSWAGKTREGAMFCSSCGTECPLSAKFCGHYGHQINDVTQNTTRKVDEGGASSGTSLPLTFKQFKSRKEEDRKGYFRNKSGNKLATATMGTKMHRRRAFWPKRTAKHGAFPDWLVGPGYNCTESSTPSVHVHTFLSLNLQQQLFLFAATLFYLQQLYYLQHVPCGPP